MFNPLQLLFRGGGGAQTLYRYERTTFTTAFAERVRPSTLRKAGHGGTGIRRLPASYKQGRVQARGIGLRPSHRWVCLGKVAQSSRRLVARNRRSAVLRVVPGHEKRPAGRTHEPLCRNEPRLQAAKLRRISSGCSDANAASDLRAD